MTAAATELLDLVARWIHVIAGIMWVGNSLLFNWLDRNLHSKAEHYQGSGAIWLLHSGGFYYVEKTLLPGQKLPVPMHWFKWQAYTTWLSGLALLLAVYWVGGRAVMIDPSRATLTQGTAVLIGAGAIFIGWATYELANRLVAPKLPGIGFAVWFVAFIAIAYALTALLDGRAAYLHVGALLGTVMAGNVFFTIVPSQRQLVAAVETGRQQEAVADSARAKRVSIHNNYFTFPVIALMVISHFPGLYGANGRLGILFTIVAAGVAVRHTLNIRYTLGSWLPLLGSVIVAAVVLLRMFQQQTAPPVGLDDSAPVTFADARHVIDRRCAVCHSAQPADLTFGPAAGGVSLDTPAQIAAYANRIHERAVVSRTMPPANKTNITDDERDLLRRWFAQGAITR
jgi:uncharacterized membrane protein